MPADQDPVMSILIVDDEKVARINLAKALKHDGYVIIQASSGAEAIEAMKSRNFDLVISDLVMPGIGGLELLDIIRRDYPGVEVIIITGYPMVETAVEAMRQGAFHYLSKPYQLSEARLLVANALEKRKAFRQVVHLRRLLAEKGDVPVIVGESQPMRQLKEDMARIAASDASVLIEGETGTGKEIAARYIHALSQRSGKRFLAINCGALPDELLESELFGHEKGAFSGAVQRKLGLFEAAQGGTLFLDELGETSSAMQVKLLRVLQERTLRRIGGTVDIPFDVRIVAATNRDLRFEVEEKRFRRDLYYRIAVFTLCIPPLSKRREDIPLLCRYFLDAWGKRSGRPVPVLSDAVCNCLKDYAFPGNVRELANIMERAVVLAEGCEQIELAHLPEDLREAAQSLTDTGEEGAMDTLEAVERRHIIKVLEYTGDNKTTAAKILGINRASLWRKLRNR